MFMFNTAETLADAEAAGVAFETNSGSWNTILISWTRALCADAYRLMLASGNIGSVFLTLLKNWLSEVRDIDGQTLHVLMAERLGHHLVTLIGVVCDHDGTWHRETDVTGPSEYTSLSCEFANLQYQNIMNNEAITLTEETCKKLHKQPWGPVDETKFKCKQSTEIQNTRDKQREVDEPQFKRKRNVRIQYRRNRHKEVVRVWVWRPRI
jgi:hypothetical protein